MIAHAMKDIQEREPEQQSLIRALCARLGNVQPDGLLEAVDDLPSQKKMDELEAKDTFLLEKANKTSVELKEEKEEHKKALDKLNLALAFNQKLETYVENTGDVINKAKLFDANLAKNPITAGKVIPILVDFVEKMVGEVVRDLAEEERRAFEESTSAPLARIDTVQTGLEELAAEWMRELQTPPSGPTPKPIAVATPRSLVRPSFLSQLEMIVKTPFKTPRPGPVFRLPVSTSTPVSTGTDTQGESEVSGSTRLADKGTEATSLAARVTRSASKQTPTSSPLPKRPYLSPSKGSSSKKRRR